ncbi:hypothetical protein F6X40_41210 [Paraburkholderia sp. UCT31]|uniref:hypothetical protein n=1 Tax=Paraburkholderia sp. UCT31 TaxID=2615209 RepID=UPI0016555C97|nr:hypothetical protein [Paraburkholderia sp. UCT31]MBC8742885.1 hypothetical protein [Paraburkholderia sp. UCT31]
MLTITGSKVDEHNRLTVTYEAYNQAPNAGSILELPVTLIHDLKLSPGKTRFRAVMEETVTGDAEAALDKLADWAERLAIAIRHRGPATAVVPSFPSPVRPKPPTPAIDAAADNPQGEDE